MAVARKWAAVVEGAILAAYLLFSLAWISLPGPDADEVLFIPVWYADSPISFYVDHFRIFQTKMVTMVSSYNGALKGWLWGLFFAAGRSIYTVRVPAALLGGLTLALFYCWVRRVYSHPTALVALLLAATDPVYIITSRIDSGPVVLQRLLLMAAVVAASSWLLDPARAARWHTQLAASGFCLGLALWDKATFAWCLLALAASLLILFPREILRHLRPAPAAVFLLFFFLGSLPLLVYNARTQDRGTREVAHWESFDAKAWSFKWANFRLTLNGRYLYGAMGGELIDRKEAGTASDASQRLLDALGWFAPQRGTLMPWALAATLLVGAVAAWRRQRAVLFPLLLTLAHWAAVFLTREAGGPHHTTLIYPFPHLAIAAAGVWLWNGASRRPAAAAALVRRGMGVALAAIVLTQLGYDARQLSAFRQVRGMGIWTDAIYDIAAHLKTARPDLVVNMDWGFGNPLLLLTDGSVRQNDFYGRVALGPGDNESARIEELLSLLSRPNTLFLFHTEPFIQFPAVKTVFERAAAMAGKRTLVVRTFYQGTGEAVAQLVQVEP